MATYALHHLTDPAKIEFIAGILPLLDKGGRLYVGDIAFETREQLEWVKTEAGSAWDDDKFYFVVDELRPHFPGLQFQAMSHCAGLLTFS